MKPKHAEALLAAVIIARSTSLLLSKLSMRSLEPLNLMALRFLLAFFLMVLLFGKRLRHLRPATVLRGLALGGTFFAVMAAELFGLRATDSTTTSFLENTAVVWVPLFEAARHRRSPGGSTLLSAAVTLTGVALLTLGRGGFHLSGGMGLCLLASLFYACAILLTARLSRQDDPLTLGILQVGFLGLLALAASLLFESPHLPRSGGEWGSILYLAVVCSCFGFTLQPVAQRCVSAQRASLFCALNPLSASLLGMVFLHEQPGLGGLGGGLLILLGIRLQTLDRLPLPHLRRTGAL